MSIQVSIPDETADELYWLMDEMDGRMSTVARAWFRQNYRPKMGRVWKRLKAEERITEVVKSNE